MEKRKNGFTLIELIAVLVILAIIALIVTPLVMNIVKKSKDSANKRSVDAYGKAVELAVATYLLDNGEYPNALEGLIVEYSGNEVVCKTKILNADGSIYLSGCSIKGVEVKDSKTSDGYYHYGKAQADGVEDIKTTYSIGDVVTYNGMNFYVIENSDEKDDALTLLKAEPLTVDEVNTYGTGHVNMYVSKNSSDPEYKTAFDEGGYGGLAYYSSSTCGYNEAGTWTTEGCVNDYVNSEIKYVVDSWASNNLNDEDLTEDSLGYKARLLTKEELINNFGYQENTDGASPSVNGETPSWVYNNNYWYWLMSPNQDSTFEAWGVSNSGILYNFYGVNSSVNGMVRPVINLKKSAI